MGSGSYGGGGGGGSGGGSAGGFGGGGGYRFHGGDVASVRVSPKRAQKRTTRILRKLPKDYVLKLFCSPLLRSVYEQLFELSVHVFQNKSWQGITKRYGVSGNPGCAMRWVEAVITKFQRGEPDHKVRDTARLCLEDFLIRALHDDLDVFLHGSSSDILTRLDQTVFKSTSGYVLGSVIWRMAEREREKGPEAVENQLRDLSQRRADQIIRSFESKYYAKEQTTYRDLFRVIQGNTGWFLRELRR